MAIKVDLRYQFLTQDVAESMGESNYDTLYAGTNSRVIAFNAGASGDWMLYGKLDYDIVAIAGGGTVDSTTHANDAAVIAAVNTDLGI